jgi:signal transduction histidine kinase
MAASIAHNIKNPLSSIKTIVQLMQEDSELTEKYSRDLALINSEIDRLTSSVTQLLKFSKPGILTNISVDLVEVLEKIVGIFAPDAGQRAIKLDQYLAYHGHRTV